MDTTLVTHDPGSHQRRFTIFAKQGQDGEVVMSSVEMMRVVTSGCPFLFFSCPPPAMVFCSPTRPWEGAESQCCVCHRQASHHQKSLTLRPWSSTCHGGNPKLRNGSIF
eukprot:s1773_g18.t1